MEATLGVGVSRDGATEMFSVFPRCGLGSIPKTGITCGFSSVVVSCPYPEVFFPVLQFSSLHMSQHEECGSRQKANE